MNDPTPTPIKAFKGFNPDMTCRGFQYEEGKTYTTDKAKVCNDGFHACEHPLDCFRYYAPGKSVFHEVELSGALGKSDDDTKVAATQIKIGQRLYVKDIVSAARDYVAKKIEQAEDKKTAGYGANLAAGYGANLAAGYRANLAAGDMANLAAGDGANLAAGYRANLAAGDWANLAAGDRANLAAGYGANLAAGDRANLAAGDMANLAAGDMANLAAGNGANLAAGDGAIAASRGSVSVGKNGVAVVRGNGIKARGGLGTILLFAVEKENNYDIREWRAVQIDGKKFKAGTWYTLKDGKITEVENA